MPGASGAQDPVPGILDAYDCGVIRAYDDRPGVPSFLDQFQTMALEAEWCVREGGPCLLPHLRRWDEPFALTVALGAGVEAESERVAAGLNGIDAGLSSVAQSRGVPVEDVVTLGPPAVPGGPQVRVAIAPREELRALARDWSVVVRGLDLEGGAAVGLSQETACWAVATDVAGAPGRLVAGFIFLDSELPPETLLHCGKEEGLNLFFPNDPIGDASLFDDPWGRRAPDPALGEQFSSRDEAMIRLLYHERLRPGQPADDALDAAGRAIHEECDGG